MPNGTLYSLDSIPAQAPARRWLWPARLAFGHVTAILADPAFPGLTVALDITARVSAGAEMPSPPERFAPGRVLILARDARHWRAELLPRLMAAGACLPRVEWLACEHRPDAFATRLKECGEGSPFSLIVLADSGMWGPEESPHGRPVTAAATLRFAARALASAISAAHSGHPAALIVAEPGPGGNGTGRAQNALRSQPDIPHAFRIGGRMGGPFTMLDQRPPNCGPVPPLHFHLEMDPAHSFARVIWNPAPPSKFAEAAAILESILASGPALGGEVKARIRAAGISPATLRRACDDLGVDRAIGRGSLWRLPHKVFH